MPLSWTSVIKSKPPTPGGWSGHLYPAEQPLTKTSGLTEVHQASARGVGLHYKRSPRHTLQGEGVDKESQGHKPLITDKVVHNVYTGWQGQVAAWDISCQKPRQLPLVQSTPTGHAGSAPWTCSTKLLKYIQVPAGVYMATSPVWWCVASPLNLPFLQMRDRGDLVISVT